MINIPNIEYKISFRKGSGSFCAAKDKNEIYLGFVKNHGLTDNELINCIADTLTHEFMHHVLDYMFPKEVSFLFDTIGESLDEHPGLIAKALTNSGAEGQPWSVTLEKEGMEGFFNSYMWLDKNRVNEILAKGC